MRQTRAVALSRLAAPTVTLITRAETKKLRQLAPWARWLFVELVIGSDFTTGAGVSSWARLMTLLDFDRAPTGRAPAGSVSLRQARDAFDSLESLGLVKRDRFDNEAQGFLSYRLTPRVRRATPVDESGRGSGRVSTGRKASNGAGSR